MDDRLRDRLTEVVGPIAGVRRQGGGDFADFRQSCAGGALPAGQRVAGSDFSRRAHRCGQAAPVAGQPLLEVLVPLVVALTITHTIPTITTWTIRGVMDCTTM